jgi:Flp pilus assembly protein TadG
VVVGTHRRFRISATEDAPEQGATLVEAALLMPILILLVFGIIEFGMAFKDSLSVSSATRSGARTATAEPRTASYATDTAAAVAKVLSALPSNGPQQLWIYKADSNGMPDSGNFTAQCNVCVIYNWDPTTRAWNTSAPVRNNWPATGTGGQNACSSTADSVGIWLKANHKMVTGLFGSAMTLTDHTVMRLEPMPSDQACSG